MKEKKPKRQESVRKKILVSVSLVQIPIIILYFIIAGNYASRVVEQQWKYQNAAVKTYLTNLSDDIRDIDAYLFYDCFYALSDPESEDYLEKLSKESQTFISDNKLINGLVLSDDENGKIYYAVSSDVSREEMLKVYQSSCAECEKTREGWSVQETGGNYYLVRSLSVNGTTAKAIISMRRLAATAQNNYNMTGSALILYKGEMLTSTLWQRNASEEIPDVISSPCILESGNRKYMLSEGSLVGLRIVYGEVYLFTFNWVYMVGLLMVALAFISVTVMIFYLDRSIVGPLAGMTDIMKKISAGEKDLRLPEAKTEELQDISESFNTMMDRVNEAKIESYEYQLTARRAKMDALRLQIRRHFFLNCLKNIYAMSSTGDFEGIKQTAFLLSGNLRYTLNFDEDSVPLRRELDMCVDYIKLQGVGQTMKPMLIVDSDEALDDFPIPPVSLLTILENSCKYGMKQDSPLVIRIITKIRSLDDNSFAVITVHDNGPGYNAEMLKLLNQDMNRVQENNHIGMANTLLRFKMLHGDECSVLFSNSNGAKVVLMIPMKKNTEKEDI